MHDGHHQSIAVQIDGNAQVHVVVNDQLVVTDRGIEMRKAANRLDGREGDKGQVRE